MVKDKKVTSEQLAHAAVEGLQEKKGIDIALIDLREVPNAFTDFFVIASGSSDTQAGALSDSVEEVIYKKLRQQPLRREGKENKEWILIDYVDIVVHVFLKSKRSFYGLEALWGDGKITTYENI